MMLARASRKQTRRTRVKKWKCTLRILHVGDQAGVAGCLAKYQRGLGHIAHVVKKAGSDSRDINGFYGTIFLPEQTEEREPRSICHSRLLSASWRKYRRLRESFKFYLQVARLAKQYDVVHIHSVFFYDLFTLLNKKNVVLFHGSDIRREPRFSYGLLSNLKFALQRVYFRMKCRFFVSTQDLLRDLPKATWMPNPVDVDHFARTEPYRPGTAFYILNWYENGCPAKEFALLHGLKLTTINRAENKALPYKELPAFLQTFEYFIDRKAIPSMSKSALEALHLGLKVVTWDGRIIQSLPKQHHPDEVTKKWETIYREIADEV